ncbi:gliding motility-associated C-terminal domain-containing protein, partial [Mariniphaga anaerophila]
CFGETATVTLSAQGGTGAYAYTFNGTTNSTGVFENIAAGTDYAWSVTDENSCEDSGSIDVTQPEDLLCSTEQDSPVTIFGESNGVATVTVSGGVEPYSYLWDNNETTATASQLNAGTHSVTITDGNGCETSCEVTITEPGQLSCSVVMDSQVVCFDEANGQATVSVTGGVQPYSYLWDNGETTATATQLNAGTHEVTVTDTNGAETTCNVIITQPEVLEASAEVTAEIKCFDGTATVTLSAQGGTGAYSFTFNGTTNSTGVFENIAAGTDYAWSVKDANSCEDSGSIDVTQPALLEAEANVTAAIKCFDGTATVTLSAQGGTGVYSYTFNETTNSTGVFENIAAGTDYAWSVTDENSCEDSGSIDVTQPTLLEAEANVTAAIKCFDGTATVTLSAQGGTGAYAYTFNGTTNSTGVFENIAAGTDYAWSVTDENSCEDSGSIDVTQPEDLLCSTEQDSPVTIFGASDGVATVTVSGGVEPYSYLWDNNETTATASQLNAGLHSVTVTDNNGCETSCEVTITEPGQLSCSVVMDSQVVCFDESNGQATVSVTGGVQPYSYEWDNGETTATATQLNAGIHEVTVTDNNRAKTTCNVIITQPEVLEASAEVTAEILCFGETATVTLSAQGGTGAYAYTFNGTTNSTGVFENIAAGNGYAWSVTDENSCEDSGSIDVTQPTLLEAEANVTAEIKCFDGTATVTLSAQGGTGAYAYTFNGTTNTTGVFENIAAGTNYAWSVTDKNSCEDSGSIDVTQPEDLLCSTEQDSPVTIFGASDGAATVTVSGGVEPYSYLWDNNETTATASQLNAGTHSVTITDGNGCKTSCEVTITEPGQLSCSVVMDSQVVCFGEDNGQATVSVTGGVQPYSYLWDNGETTATASQLNAGTHEVTVTDANGAKTTCNVIITQPEVLEASAEVTAEILCFGETATVTLSAQGGTGAYSYTFNGTTNSTGVFENIAAGTDYAWSVTDENSCEDSGSIDVTQPTLLEAEANVTAAIKCFDGTATVTLSAQGGTGVYAYTFNGTTNSTGVFENIAAGTDYAWSVTDENSCEDSGSIDVTQPALLSIEITNKTDVICSSDADGAIDITVSGGTLPYSFEWTKDGESYASTEDLTDLSSGVYTVTVTDGNECSSTETVTINVLDTEAPILVGQIPQGETAMNLCFTEIPEGPTEEQIASLFTDNYDGVNVSKTGTPEGENCNWTVTYNYTITDDCGNEAEPVSVTYQGGDTDAPVFTCNSISINIRTNGIYILSNTDISRLTGEVTDNCTSEEDITIDVNPRRFSCEDVGKDVVVTITATDLCGNVSECETTVAVRDNRPPEILCPGDIVVSNDEGSNGAVVNFEATATDNCSATVTYSHQPGSEFPIGTTLVTATATDPSGNTSNCTFNITVTDGESPELICPDDITVSNDEGECGAIVFFEAQASDNTSNVTVTYSHEPGSLFPVGTTTVTITAADDDNNTVTCSFDITVTDDEAPFISCTEDIEVAADAGMCEATVQIPALVEVGDNCNYSYANDFNEGIDASGTYPIGTTVVTWTVTDESGNSATCSMTVTVTDEEDPFISCTEDIEVTAEAGECEADVLVPALAEVGDNCNFTYTNDFNGGTDASGTYPVGTTVVTWTVTDGSGNTATCSVTVTVIAAPVAVDDETSTSYNSPVDIAILENDMDCKNSLDPNSVTVTEDPANGTVTFDSETGMATYTPATGFTGTDTFTYSVCNEDGLCDDAVVTINIGAPGNYPPVAINDINHTFANLQVNGWVMTNDYDPDGDDLTVSTELISNPENGTVELRADGSYTYTPNSGFTGKDSFEYQVCDPDGLCDEAVVTISVIEERAEENRPPVAIEDNYKGMINVPVTGNLLANDYDPDKDNIEITVTPVTSPNSGILEINTDGTFSFYPENDFTGDVTFTYRICDDGTPSLCDEATVTIKIRTDINGIGGENANTTVGVDDAFYVEEGSVFESDVSQNDYDPEGDNQVNFTLLVPPSNGTMALFPNGTFSFEPYSGFTGNDFFIYEVCDDGDPTACDRATAYIIVEEPATDEEEGGGGEQEPECEMFIPEGFSPNNDGINDYFNILCFDDYPNAKLEVYNRWGVLLYEQENYGNSDDWGSVDAWWDGTSNRKWTVGKEKLPMGTYFYILYLNDGSEPITGSVFLNR